MDIINIGLCKIQLLLFNLNKKGHWNSYLFGTSIKEIDFSLLDLILFRNITSLIKDAKPFKGVGPGVIEIAIKHDKEAYRCVQAVQLRQYIYVLHAFQKKSKKGISTPQFDIDLIKKRYKEAKELQTNE